jgi:translation initiation factor 5B
LQKNSVSESSKVSTLTHSRVLFLQQLTNGFDTADIIYHLFDAFTAYNASVMEQKKADAAPKAVWPCRLKTIACFARGGRKFIALNLVFIVRSLILICFAIAAIILGVDIIEGTLRIGTPLCVVKTDPETKKKTVISLGKV